MNNTIEIFCKNTNRYVSVEAGISLLGIYRSIDLELPYLLAGAKVNNKTESLAYKCYNPKDVEFIDVSHPSGMRAYVRSLCFVLACAVDRLYPKKKIYFEHPISKGYYCDLQLGRAVNESDCLSLRREMGNIIAHDFPIQSCEGHTADVVKLFRENNMEDKAILMETLGEVYSKYSMLDGFIDYYYGAMLPSTGWIYLFDLNLYNGGLLLRSPDMENPKILPDFFKQDKMMNVFKEQLSYQRVMKMENVGDLNKLLKKGYASDIVKIAEAFQEKKISQIADEIYEGCERGVKIILISGPTSSGKTTFSKRLRVQLQINTLNPLNLSLDDYFVDREHTPNDENGDYDFESLYAIDIDKFDEDMNTLIGGGEISVPRYDFSTGKRVYRGEKLKMGKNAILILEGIHALNPELVKNIDQNSVFKIYVSALTAISIDDHNWIPTTDNRLIRRIIRDYKFRKYSAKDTIARWKSVRKGEEKWIFPYQEEADAMFNSAMLYELAALRRDAEPILREVLPMDPEYSESYRLLRFLKYFNYMSLREVPEGSLLREFLGGSSFKY